MGNEIFEEIKRKYKKSNKYMLYVSYEDIGTLLNLIEKQSKEIEELKTEKANRSWVHIKENGEVEPLFYVSEDKIKAKIEELEKEQEDNRKVLYNAVNNLYFKEIDIISNKISVNMSIRDVLQSLLEKENNNGTRNRR